MTLNSTNTAQVTIDQIFEVFQTLGNSHYGENVSELEHALQTAEFARQFDESDAVILSCLLHDYRICCIILAKTLLRRVSMPNMKRSVRSF